MEETKHGGGRRSTAPRWGRVASSPQNAHTSKKGTILVAAWRGEEDYLRRILEEDPTTVNARAFEGDTPLHYASLKGHLGIASLCLENKAAVDAVNHLDWTPLHEASYKGHSDVAELLLQHGASVEVRSEWGRTPLHWACLGGHKAVAELLVRNGADVNARDQDGKTPLDEAKTAGYGELATALEASAVEHVQRTKRVDDTKETSDDIVLDMEVKMDRLSIDWSRTFGWGGFGRVFHGVLDGNKHVAVKQIKIPPSEVSDGRVFYDFKSDVADMVKVRSEYLVDILGVAAIREAHEFYVISDLYTRGSLFDLVYNLSEPLPEKLAVQLLLDAARGVLYLHQNQIIHRSLKCSNIILTDKDHAKVSDYGLEKTMRRINTMVGNPLWMSPEAMMDLPKTPKMDVYSFAMIMVETFERETPWAKLIPTVVINEVINGRRPEMKNTPARYRDIIRASWAQNPIERPSFEEILLFLERRLRDINELSH